MRRRPTTHLSAAPLRLLGAGPAAARGGARALLRRRGLRALRSDAHPAAAAVGRALTRALAGGAVEERAWAERIEALRSELVASDELISTPLAAWSGDDSHAGHVERPVRRLALEGSRPAHWGMVLLCLVRELAPQRCLELGTCAGISAAYQAAALNLGGGDGRLVTVDADPARTELAARNLARLSLDTRVETRVGRFYDVLDSVLERGPFELAFIDGHHDEHATVDYFRSIAAAAPRPAIVVLDDIAWSAGMERAWHVVGAEPDVALALDLRGTGLCVLDSCARKRRLSVPMP